MNRPGNWLKGRLDSLPVLLFMGGELLQTSSSQTKTNDRISTDHCKENEKRNSIFGLFRGEVDNSSLSPDASELSWFASQFFSRVALS